MGLSPDAYAALRWFEYVRLCEGYSFRSAREWEHTRMIVHLLICRDWDKSKGTPPTAHELLPLITDNVKIDENKGEQLKQKLASMREYLKSRQQ